MRKFISTLLLVLCGLFTANAAPFSLQYSEDFSVQVKVPATNSTTVTKAQKMNKTITALELSELMGNGINLGNTLEATRNWYGDVTKKTSYYETIWGQPLTTPQIMQGYKSAGFDSVRIPVAWTNMMLYEKGDYTISPKLLDRVEEVVNYALDAGLYVIINDHWDSQWWGMFGSENKALRKEAVKLYKSMWTQIAVRFKNYDERLIFEGANEELGSRLNDDTAFSKGKRGILSEEECYDATNKINQCFVDVVRGTGGNNKYRFLLIPGFNTDIDKTNSNLFKMPSDKVKNRLFISVHYYTPSTYCIINEDVSWGRNKTSWGTKQDIRLMNTLFEKMKSFSDQGYGVIIGEYGVTKTKQGEMKDGMCDWIKNVLVNCDQYNYVPMLWDCNTFFKKTEPIGFENEEVGNIFKKE